jgi:hypothetical protein
MTRRGEQLLALARKYQGADMAVPVDLESKLLEEGLSLENLDTNQEHIDNG